MKTEVQFVLDRANATISVAAAIQTDWVWSEETIAQMQTATKALAAQADLSDSKNTALTKAIAQKNAAFGNYHQITVTLLGMTKTHYRNDSAATATLKNLHAKGQSDQDILDEGAKFARPGPNWTPPMCQIRAGRWPHFRPPAPIVRLN